MSKSAEKKSALASKKKGNKKPETVPTKSNAKDRSVSKNHSTSKSNRKADASAKKGQKKVKS